MIDQLRVRHRIPLCGSMLIHGVMAILPVRRIISPFLTIITAMAFTAINMGKKHNQNFVRGYPRL
jgi:hypothetical protein